MWLHVFGRLKEGVTIERAQAAANVTFQQGLAAHYGSALSPADQKAFLNQRLKLSPAATGASQIRGQFAEPLTVLLAAAGLVLLIACANLGNLLLARATARTREVSVRLALGAARGRIVRQLLTESMVVALLGGITGLAAAWLLRVGLIHLVSDSIHLPATPDARVLGFIFALTLAAGLILGLLPALRTMGINVSRWVEGARARADGIGCVAARREARGSHSAGAVAAITRRGGSSACRPCTTCNKWTWAMRRSAC